MLFGNAPLIGLDLGSGMVKAAAVRRKGDRLVVERAGIAALPGGAMSGRVYLDPPAVAECVRKLCHDVGLRGRRTAVAMAGDEVFHARLKVERGAVPHLDTLVRQEVSKLAPFSLNEALLDYHVLDNFAHSQWVDAVAVAARRLGVERVTGVVERSGKTVEVVDSAACALTNVFELNYEPAAADITALVHLGAAILTVCILRGTTPLVVKDLTLETTSPWRDQPSPAERVAVELDRVFEQLDEIADDHPLEPRSSQISRLLLSGGGSRLKGLEEVLKTRVRCPIEFLEPFRKIDFPSTDALGRLVWDHAHCMPVAVGLALRGLEVPAQAASVPV